jgi:predicted ATP-grasp superfamily ATP-dependent carboligase
MKAFVVPCRRNGLGVIRSLGKGNIKIVGIDYSFQAGLYSKHVCAKYIIPDPTSDEIGFMKGIIKIAKIHAISDKIFLYPTDDECVWAFANNWSLLNKYFYPVFETDPKILGHCIDKIQMYKIAEKAQIPFPKTIYNPIKYEECSNIRFPVIVKPYNSHFPDCKKYNLKKAYFCDNHEVLKNTFKFFGNVNIPFIAQEFIGGADNQLYSIGIFSFKGNIIGSFTGRKIRQYPNNTGECSFGELVSLPILSEYAESFVSELKFTGIAQLEFKKHNGVLYFIEINPRSWSWNSLATFSGVNLPLIGLDTINNSDLYGKQEQIRFSGRWMHFLQDLTHNVIVNKNISFIKILREALAAECHAFWDRTDPLPYLIYLVKIIRSFLGKAVDSTLRG